MAAASCVQNSCFYPLCRVTLSGKYHGEGEREERERREGGKEGMVESWRRGGGGDGGRE